MSWAEEKKKKGREDFLPTYQGPNTLFFFKPTTSTPMPTAKALLFSWETEMEQNPEKGFQEEVKFLRNRR